MRCSVRTGQWLGDCFVYTNSTNRLNYLVGDQTYTISHFDSPHYVLGYLARDARVYVCDKDVAVTSFALSVSVIEYQDSCPPRRCRCRAGNAPGYP